MRYVSFRGMVNSREAHLARRAILHYIEHDDSYAAAEIAGFGRAEFLWLAAERGVPMLKGPSCMEETLESLGRDLADERLSNAAQRLAESKATPR